MIACQQAVDRQTAPLTGAASFPVSCAGNLHTSVIELLLRGGCAGVLVLTCPPRDCWNREGPRWLTERVYNGREAELQERVDRARVRVASVSSGHAGATAHLVAAFVEEIAALGREPAAQDDGGDPECRTAHVTAGTLT